MLNLVSQITITQQPTTTYSSRSNVYVLNFVNDCEISSSWKNLTDTAKLILPKNVYMKTGQGLVSWAGKDVYKTTDQPPILMRGDRIKIELGYYYKVNTTYTTQLNTEFEGFITKINPKIPMEIECEDTMWLLKQAQCPNMVFPEKSWTLQKIIKYLLKNAKVSSDNVFLSNTLIPELAKINVINGVGESENIQTNLGDFRTQNETIAQVLQRLRKDYKIECFFRNKDGNLNLYCSGIVYYPSDFLASDGNFIATNYDFEKNIVKNDMVYLRSDDVRLGIKAYSVGKYELTTANKDGKLKTKNKRLEVSVGDTDGEIRTQFFYPETNTSPDLDLKTLTLLAKQRINKLKYEGWRGQFTSYGLPFVRHGEAISLNSEITPERNGVYLVRGVKTKFGTNGQPAFSRTIDPHIRIDDNKAFALSDFANGL